MLENMLENPWFINLICDIVLIPICWYIINYFTDEQKWKRKRIKCCKQAIHNIIQRFNISVRIIGSGGGHIHGPILTYNNYILVLYELFFVINNWDSSIISDQTFKDDALSWHQDYVNNHMQNAIEVLFSIRN